MFSRPMIFPTRSIGINIVGYLSGNLGLGVTARPVASLILSKNLPLAAPDLDAGAGKRDFDLSFRDYTVSNPGALPHAITLFVLLPQTIFAFAQDAMNRSLLFRRDGIKAAMLIRELPDKMPCAFS